MASKTGDILQKTDRKVLQLYRWEHNFERTKREPLQSTCCKGSLLGPKALGVEYVVSVQFYIGIGQKIFRLSMIFPNISRSVTLVTKGW